MNANFFTWLGNAGQNLIGANQELPFGSNYNPMPKPNLGTPGMPGAQPQQPGQSYGSQLPGTGVPDLGGYKHPEGGRPTPMEEEFDSSEFRRQVSGQKLQS